MPELSARTFSGGPPALACHSSCTFSDIKARLAECGAQLPSWHVPNSRQLWRRIQSPW